VLRQKIYTTVSARASCQHAFEYFLHVAGKNESIGMDMSLVAQTTIILAYFNFRWQEAVFKERKSFEYDRCGKYFAKKVKKAQFFYLLLSIEKIFIFKKD